MNPERPSSTLIPTVNLPDFQLGAGVESSRAEPVDIWNSLTEFDQIAVASMVADEFQSQLFDSCGNDLEAVYFSFCGRDADLTPCVALALRPAVGNLHAASSTLPQSLSARIVSQGGDWQCAVPTHIVTTSREEPVPQARTIEPRKIAVAPSGRRRGELGIITARVELIRGGTRETLALSCLHVFGNLVHGRGRPRRDADVRLQASRRLLARPVHWGSIRPGEDVKDMALARILDSSRIWSALALPAPTNYARNILQIRQHKRFDIWTARGPIRAIYKEYLTSGVRARRAIRYRPFRRRSYFNRVVRSRTSGRPTLGGDSGSPVYSTDGRTLLGMHIAGDGRSTSYMVPAYELLKARHYNLRGSKLRFV